MEIIKSYFPELSADQLNKFEQLKPLYEEWNSKINVISRKDMDAFYCNHVLHSLAIVKLAPLDSFPTVLDIGTGGGFPGIPLAIYYPSIQFTLVDSIRKKIKVVDEVSSALNLTNVTTVVDRFENLDKVYSCIVSRAVAPALKLVSFTRKSLDKKGVHVFIKGGDLSVEKEELVKKYPHKKWEAHDVSSVFKEAFFETKKVIVLR